MYKPLVIIVPTRSRPHNVPKVIEAWRETRGFYHADLLFAYDLDDPAANKYNEAVLGSGALSYPMPRWQPMVPKLNHVARKQAALPWRKAIGFAGDDHAPVTRNWAEQYMNELMDLQVGIVYGNDLHQGQRLPTEWAMTTNIVQALDRMVPAPVEHLYCDNSVLELGQAAECIRYLPHVIIEHRHPVAKKTYWDQQYRAVNNRQQHRKDRTVFEQWKVNGLPEDMGKIKKLKEGL